MAVISLSEREKSILRYVIHQFILTASPVGSRNISKKYNIGLSPATIRNIMADLEETGFLGHPHTSAGRVPTDRGYRFYVDSLMAPPELKKNDIEFISTAIPENKGDYDELIQLTANVLSSITNQLALVTYPKIGEAVLDKIQLVQVSSSKILVVLSIKSGLVKTITVEIESKISRKELAEVERLFNQRLSGLTFNKIRKSFAQRLNDKLTGKFKPLIRLFLESADKIFADNPRSDRAVLKGAKNILHHPEFEDQNHFESVIELIENKEIIVHLMDKTAENSNGIKVKIGKEIQNKKFEDYSLITQVYSVGNTSGVIGLVGPKRMEYSKSMASVMYLAHRLTKVFNN